MSGEKRYAVTIGVCVVPSGTQPRSDFGIHYGSLHYADLVAVEAIAARHKPALDAAMEPMIADLVALGVEQAKVLDPEHASRLSTLNGPSEKK